MIVVRYADDTIVGFHEHEARAFLDDLKERMRKFKLALHPAKTRLIRFGRDAAKQRETLGEGKPETFDFLGFTHFCTRSRKWGTFVIGRKTIKKRMRAKLLAIKIELRRIIHDLIAHCPVTASTPEPEGGARCVSSARRDLCGGEEKSSSLPRPCSHECNCCRHR